MKEIRFDHSLWTSLKLSSRSMPEGVVGFRPRAKETNFESKITKRGESIEDNSEQFTGFVNEKKPSAHVLLCPRLEYMTS